MCVCMPLSLSLSLSLCVCVCVFTERHERVAQQLGLADAAEGADALPNLSGNDAKSASSMFPT
jgi:hypothetical protein